MTIITTMAELKEKALQVTEGMEVFLPHYNKRENLHLEGIEPEKHCMEYAYKDSVVAFVDEKGRFFAIPDLKGTQKTLGENGYKKGYFYVPFSDWDYPMEHTDKWKALWDEKNAK